jgi:hypothetical protein
VESRFPQALSPKAPSNSISLPGGNAPAGAQTAGHVSGNVSPSPGFSAPGAAPVAAPVAPSLPSGGPGAPQPAGFAPKPPPKAPGFAPKPPAKPTSLVTGGGAATEAAKRDTFEAPTVMEIQLPGKTSRQKFELRLIDYFLLSNLLGNST